MIDTGPLVQLRFHYILAIKVVHHILVNLLSWLTTSLMILMHPLTFRQRKEG